MCCILTQNSIILIQVMEMSNKLGEFIRSVRLEKDISLRKLAEISDVSFSHLSKVERGDHVPSKDIIEKLSASLEVSEYDLLILAGYQTEAETRFWIEVFEETISDERYFKFIKDLRIFSEVDMSVEAIKFRNEYMHGSNMSDEQREIISEYFFAVASRTERKPIKHSNRLVSEVKEEIGEEYLKWIELADKLSKKGYTPESVMYRLEELDEIETDLSNLLIKIRIKDAKKKGIW